MHHWKPLLLAAVVKISSLYAKQNIYFFSSWTSEVIGSHNHLNPDTF